MSVWSAILTPTTACLLIAGKEGNAMTFGGRTAEHAVNRYDRSTNLLPFSYDESKTAKLDSPKVMLRV